MEFDFLFDDCIFQIKSIMKANEKITSDADPNFYMKYVPRTDINIICIGASGLVHDQNVSYFMLF